MFRKMLQIMFGVKMFRCELCEIERTMGMEFSEIAESKDEELINKVNLASSALKDSIQLEEYCVCYKHLPIFMRMADETRATQFLENVQDGLTNDEKLNITQGDDMPPDGTVFH